MVSEWLSIRTVLYTSSKYLCISDGCIWVQAFIFSRLRRISWSSYSHFWPCHAPPCFTSLQHVLMALNVGEWTFIILRFSLLWSRMKPIIVCLFNVLICCFLLILFIASSHKQSLYHSSFTLCFKIFCSVSILCLLQMCADIFLCLF